MKKIKNTKWWAPIVHFAVHAVQGAVIFVTFALVALALGVFVEHLKVWGASEFTVVVFSGLENILVLVDAASFLWYIVTTALQALKEF